MDYATISKYLKKTGMKPAAFGRAAVNDPRLVFDIRNGRQVRPNTANRLRQFMELNQPAAA